MTKETKKCPYCNEIIDASAATCPICYEELPVEEMTKEFRCPYCNEIIEATAEVCPICCETIVSSDSQPNIEGNIIAIENDNTTIQEAKNNLQEEEYQINDVTSVISQNCEESISGKTENDDVSVDSTEQERSSTYLNNYVEYMNKVDDKLSDKWIYIVVGVIVLSVITMVYLVSKNQVKFVEGTIPDKYLAEKQIPNSEFWYSLRYDLFKLYKLQQLSPSERIREYEEPSLNPISGIIAEFVDKKQQYKMAENYCVKYNKKLEFPDLEKVACKNPKPITDLPYKQCEKFKVNQKNNDNIYYSYNLEPLWKEFKNKGIKRVENEITREENAVKAAFESNSSSKKSVNSPKPVTTPAPVTKTSTHPAKPTSSNNIRNTNSTQKAYSAGDEFRRQWDEINRKEQQTYNNSSNSSQNVAPSDAVWKFINAGVGANSSYGIDKKRFSQAPLTKETVEEIYAYVKYRVNNYETRAEIIHADVDVDSNAGKIFYNFYVKVKTSGEVIKLPVWTIRVQP